MLWTTVVFVLLAGLLLWRQASAHQRRQPKPQLTNCPRCTGPVPRSAPQCPHCNVPLSAFEVVNAAASQDAPSGGKAHAIVRTDLCVGCGVCVGACPNPGAISLKGKLAVVDLSLCDGAGKCAEACPTQGIVVSAGGNVHRVEVPDVDVNFQTNVPGIYIVGELGGRGLIKNAINEGRIVVEHVARVLPPGKPRTDGDADTFDVVIVGSGPAGLSAGLEAHRIGLKYVILEQGSIADTVQRYPRHKLLLAEPVTMPLYGDLWVADASKEMLVTVWRTIVERTGIDVRTQHRVTALRRDRPFWHVESTSGTFRTRKVVLALGRRGTPRKLGVPGEDQAKVVYDVIEMSAFAGRRVLVVGGGDSAIESVLGLSNQPGTKVVMSYRGATFERAAERNRKKLQDAVRAGKVRLILSSNVTSIGPSAVEIAHDGTVETIPNDDVIVRIGGEPPYPLLEKIGVRMVRKDIPLARTA